MNNLPHWISAEELRGIKKSQKELILLKQEEIAISLMTNEEKRNYVSVAQKRAIEHNNRLLNKIQTQENIKRIFVSLCKWIYLIALVPITIGVTIGYAKQPSNKSMKIGMIALWSLTTLTSIYVIPKIKERFGK